MTPPTLPVSKLPKQPNIISSPLPIEFSLCCSNTLGCGTCPRAWSAYQEVTFLKKIDLSSAIQFYFQLLTDKTE